MKNKKINKKNSRFAAVLPCNSIMLQAPAGSGKTELIIRRYIRILSQGNTHPKEVLVLTFTRKTVSEIKKRILKKINDNKQKGGDKCLLYTLARNLPDKSSKHGWNLLCNAKSILVLTIDSFCLYVVNKYLSKKEKSRFSILSNPESIYKKAIRKLFLGITNNPPWEIDLRRVFLHVDNNLNSLELLFVEILVSREQWFNVIKYRRKNISRLKKETDAALEKTTIESFVLSEIYRKKDLIKDMIAVGDFFAHDYLNIDKKNLLGILKGSHSAKIANNLGVWGSLLSLLKFILCFNEEKIPLKKSKIEYILSKKVHEKKIIMKNLIKNNYRLSNELSDLNLCFSIFYNKKKWNFISSVVKILPILITYLEVTFRSNKVFDFISLNILAARLLNESVLKKEKLLKIKHILIDEFQDISFSQFSLIKRVAANWNESSPNSFFAVGDPSQSIYSFRNADVSLFLSFNTKDYIGKSLKIIKLRKNFRTCRSMVYWTNKLFKNIFSNKFNTYIGSTMYNPSKAMGKNTGDIRWYIKHNDNLDTAEAENISFLIQKIRKKWPEDSIAILFRSRSHVKQVIKQLRSDFVAFDFTEHEDFSRKSEAIDILAMFCSTLLHTDKSSWLSFLKSPLFGLSLRDLSVISHFEGNGNIYRLLKSGAVPKNLSNDAISRIKIYLPIFYKMTLYRKVLPITTIVNIMLKELFLKGIINSNYNNTSIINYLRKIQELESAKTLSFQNLKHALEEFFYGKEERAKNKVRIMTIHKSKGLEFDHVIIPGLHRTVSRKSKKIINWQTKINNSNLQDMMISIQKSEDPVNKYINLIEQDRARNENKRLMYVAMTRSKKTLNLMANINTNIKGSIKIPSRNSFLEMLWNQSNATVQKAFKIFNFNLVFHKKDHETKRSRYKRSYVDSKNTLLPLETLIIDKDNNKVQGVYFCIIEDISNKTTAIILNGENFILKKLVKQHFMLNILREANFTQYFVSILQKLIKRMLFDPRSQWIMIRKANFQSDVHYCSFIDKKSLWSVKKIKFIDLTNSRFFLSTRNRNLTPLVNYGVYSVFSSHWTESSPH